MRNSTGCDLVARWFKLPSYGRTRRRELCVMREMSTYREQIVMWGAHGLLPMKMAKYPGTVQPWNL